MANYEVNQILRRVKQMQAFGQPVSSYSVRGAVRGALEASQERATRAAEIGLQQRGLELKEKSQREDVRLRERAQEIQSKGTETAEEAQESQSLSGYMVGGSLLYSPLKEMGVAGYEWLAGAGAGASGAGAGGAEFGTLTGGAGAWPVGAGTLEGGAGAVGTGGGVTAGGAGVGTMAGIGAAGIAGLYLSSQQLADAQKKGRLVSQITPWSDTGATGMIMNTAFAPITVPLAIADYVTESIGSFFSDAFGW